ncbi:MAG: sensor histidine kinase [Micrococcaceae bacterium]
MTPSFVPEAPATRAEKRNVLFSAGIWLLFLGWTVYGFIVSTAPVLWQVLGWVALPSFVVIYLYSFLHPEPVRGWGRLANTGLYTVVLVALGFVMMLSALAAVVNIVPFLMALWLFNHRMRTGLIAVALIAVVVTSLVVALQLEAYESWLLPSVGIPTVILVMVRISIELEENQRMHSERLLLAEQRDELAGTVHDLLGHSLTTITVKTQLAQRLLDADPVAARAELEDILALSRRSLSEVRATVTDLRQPELAVQLDQAEASLRAAGVSVQRPNELPALTLVQQQVFAWVLREAVTNVIRHAGASQCVLRFVPQGSAEAAGPVSLQIDDDGAGPGERDGSGETHGVSGMRHRVEAAGGRFSLEPLHPGTRVEALL